MCRGPGNVFLQVEHVSSNEITKSVLIITFFLPHRILNQSGRCASLSLIPTLLSDPLCPGQENAPQSWSHSGYMIQSLIASDATCVTLCNCIIVLPNGVRKGQVTQEFFIFKS